MGTVETIAVFFEDLKVNLDLLIMPDVPFDVIVGCPAMEELKTCKDLGNRNVSIQVDGNEVQMPLDYDRSGDLRNLMERPAKTSHPVMGTEDRNDRLDNSEEDILNFVWDGSDSGFETDDDRDCGDESRPEFVAVCGQFTVTGNQRENIRNEGLREEVGLMGVEKGALCEQIRTEREKRTGEIEKRGFISLF